MQPIFPAAASIDLTCLPRYQYHVDVLSFTQNAASAAKGSVLCCIDILSLNRFPIEDGTHANPVVLSMRTEMVDRSYCFLPFFSQERVSLCR